MADEGSKQDNKGEGQRGAREVEQEDRVCALVLRRSKLDEDEVVLLDQVFTRMMHSHHRAVWDQLRRRGLAVQEVEDLVQDTFTTLYEQILEQGFPAQIVAALHAIARGKLLNHLRGEKRLPFSFGLPTSSTEPPRTGPELERALDLHALHRQLLPLLTPEQRSVVELVVLNGLSNLDAAAVLGIPEGTLKSRLVAAKKALHAEAQRILPPSQRGAS